MVQTVEAPDHKRKAASAAAPAAAAAATQAEHQGQKLQGNLGEEETLAAEEQLHAAAWRHILKSLEDPLGAALLVLVEAQEHP